MDGFEIRHHFQPASNQLLLVWLVNRCRSTSLSMLFKAAMSIPKAAATLDMLSPKDLRSSRKSISSPVIGLCSFGQERLHCGQLHTSTCRALHCPGLEELPDAWMLLGARRLCCSLEKCAESCSKERTGVEEESRRLPCLLLESSPCFCLRRFSSFFNRLLSCRRSCLRSSLLNRWSLLTLRCLFLLRLRRCFCSLSTDPPRW